MGLVSFERTFQKLSKAHVVHSDWSKIKDTVLLQCMKKFVFCCGWTNHLIWLIAPKKIIAGKTRLVYLKGQGHRKIIKRSFAPWGLLMAQSKLWKGVLFTKKWEKWPPSLKISKITKIHVTSNENGLVGQHWCKPNGKARLWGGATLGGGKIGVK